VGHLLEAARQASDTRDLSGAEGYYQQAIELIDAGLPDPHRRIEAACGLGEAQRDQSNPLFRETLLEATHAALAVGRLDLAAVAAIANFRGTTSAVNEVDSERVEALELALAAYDGRRDAAAALLAATLVAENNYDPGVAIERRLELTDRCIAIARELAEPRTLNEVVIRTARMHLLPERAEAGVALVTEALSLADEIGDPTLKAISRVFANVSYSVVGDLTRSERCITEGVEIARSDCPPFILALCQANAVQYLLYRGGLAEASSANDELLGTYQQIGIIDGEQWWAATAMSVAFVQGTFGDAADPAGEFADRYPTASAWRCTHALALADAGRLDEAREVIERHALNHPERFPVDEFLTSAWGYVGLLALLLDDAALGAAAESMLRSCEHLWICVQIFNLGPVTWTLAAAVAGQGRYDEAEVLFSRADAALAERGLALHRNVVALYRATGLSRSDSPAHRQRARELARAGAEYSRQAGLDRLQQRFDNVLGSIPDPSGI
jgi:tetratricopeptide (TPR) repeat protein